ncbi:MAG: acyl carrier protein [Nitrospirota bacterium]
MAEVTQEMRDEVTKIAYDFFAEECEVERDSLNDDTNVIEDIEGDSLMVLELVETFKKKYNLNVDLKSIGQYMIKNQADTIGKMIKLILLIIEHEEKIADLD